MRHKYPNDIKQQCHEHGISYPMFVKRVLAGMSIEDALNTPLWTKGILPESYVERQRIYQRIKSGIPVEHASLSKEELKKLGYFKTGNRMMIGNETIQDFCKRLGLKTNTVYTYILRHSIEEALRHFDGESE